MTRVWTIAAVTTAWTAAACGSRQHQADREQQYFECRERQASYVASKHIAGDELGVMIDCASDGPRIRRWRTDKMGKRDEDGRALTPGEFDRIWKEIDGTGWPNLGDCANGSLEERDPVYVFDVKDDSHQATFQCQTRVVPYPYNDISDVLDLAAAQGRGNLGDDEPSEAKALDRKDKQR
jgi:hypothetical protein